MNHLVTLRCGVPARLAPAMSIEPYSFFGWIVHGKDGGRILEDLEPAFWLPDGSFCDDRRRHDFDIPEPTMDAIIRAEANKSA